MIQYLLNATAIWLLSLVVFDLFLRRESFHAYNRLYLLLTFFGGLLMPFMSYRNMAPVHTVLPIMTNTADKAGVVKAGIANAVTPDAAITFNWVACVAFLYVMGVAVSASLLVKECLLLIRFYKKGRKHTAPEGWTIVETAAGHGPFSVFKLLFVSDRGAYTLEEWDIVLAHEYRHYGARHFADLFLMRLAGIVFWFHPLVYMYIKRLLPVHEFQADDNGMSDNPHYGRFLIEQAVLHTTPSIAHSFAYSPIKNRLFMLKHRSGKIRLAKLVLVLPLTLISLLFFTDSAYSFKGGNKKVNFRGNVIEYDVPQGMPMPAQGSGNGVTVVKVKKGDSPVSGGVLEIADAKNVDSDEEIEVSFFSAPAKMNGSTVYSEGDISTDPAYAGEGSFEQYILNGMAKELNELEDGRYMVRLSYLIIDEEGKPAYYENGGIVPTNANIKIDQALQQRLTGKLAKLTDKAGPFKPGTLNGIPVISYLAWGFDMRRQIEVKNHVATLR